MMKLSFYTLLLIVVLTLKVKNCFAQNNNSQWSKIDSLAIRTPEIFSQNVDSLAKYILSQNLSEKDRVRYIYRWITYNIAYDIEGMRRLEISKKKQNIQKNLQTNKAVCWGYSNLFEVLATKTNIQSWTILGYGRNTIQENMDYHAWNGVRVNGEWKLLDLTWASGYIHDRTFTRKLNDEYFCASPHEFAKTHFPMDPVWQLTEYPLTKDNFNNNSKPLHLQAVSFQDSLKQFFTLDSINREKVFYKRCREADKDNEFCQNGFVGVVITIGNSLLASSNDKMNTYFSMLSENKNNPIKFLNNNEIKVREMIDFSIEKYQKSILIYQEGIGIDELNENNLRQNIKTVTDNKIRAEKERQFLNTYYGTKKALRFLTIAKYNEMTR
jgi:transglutaminase/protease-like cytokinesis protein 3